MPIDVGPSKKINRVFTNAVDEYIFTRITGVEVEEERDQALTYTMLQYLAMETGKKGSFRIAVNWGIEFGPIVVFFFASDTIGFMPATALFVTLTLIALSISYIRDGKLVLFPIIAGVSVISFGVATLVLKDPFYLIIKDTLYNASFALAIAIYEYVLKRSFLKELFSALFHMSDRGWSILSKRWMIMFILLTIGNEVARLSFDTHGWVVYKLWATTATVVFGFYQITLAKRERLPDASSWGLNIIR